jgi:hypothetical protein
MSKPVALVARTVVVVKPLCYTCGGWNAILHPAIGSVAGDIVALLVASKSGICLSS